jgi:hypothetical protein
VPAIASAFHCDGIDRERLSDEVQRRAGNRAALAHRQRIGVVGKQIRIVRNQVCQFLVRCRGLRKLLHRVVGTRQHDPAFDVVRLFLESLAQTVGHRRDLFVRHLVRRFRCRGQQRKRVVRTEPPVHCARHQRHGDREHQSRRAR